MNKSLFFKRFQFLAWLFPIILFSVISVLDTNNLRSPVIYSDDWCFLVTNHIYGFDHLVDWLSRRPFQATVQSILMSLAGLHFQTMIWFNLLITCAAAVLFYQLVRLAFPRLAWMALPATLIFLVYPVDYTRTWLAMLSIRWIMLVTVGVLFLYYSYLSTGGLWKFILVLTGLIYSLCAYDGQFGVLMGAAALNLLSWKKLNKSKRALGITILGIGILFVVWRLVLQHYWLHITDEYFQQLVFSPVLLIYRFYQALKLFTIDWVKPIAFYLGISQPLLVLLFGGLTLLTAAVVYLVFARRLIKVELPLEWPVKEALLRSFLGVFLVGAFFWLAGYIPAISIFSPVVSGPGSRGNLFAIGGAAVALVGICSYAITLVAKSSRQVRLMTMAVLAPFLLLSSIAQVYDHHEADAGWIEQKNLWQSMFTLLPDLKDGTMLVVVVPGYDHLRPFERLPLTVQWEANCGLVTLYNNANLNMRFFYPDLYVAQPVLLADGMQDWDTTNIIPYHNIVLVKFDATSQRLNLIDHLSEILYLPFGGSGYFPQARIVAHSPQADTYRWLVK